MKNYLLLTLGGILLVLLVMAKIDISRFAEIVSQKISWPFYVLICALIIVQLLFRAVRFKFIYKTLFAGEISYLDSFLLNSASYFVALATPSKVGDVLRGLFWKNDRLQISAISLNEYFLDIIVVVLIPIIGFFFGYSHHSGEIITGYAVFGIICFCVFCAVYYSFKKNIFEKFPLSMKYSDKIKYVKKCTIEFFTNKAVVSVGLLFTCLSYGVYFLIFYMVLLKLGAQISFLHTVVAAGVGVFVGSLTFIPMGMGTRDISGYSILTLYGLDPEVAVSAVVIVRSLSLCLLITGGFCYFLLINRLNTLR